MQYRIEFTTLAIESVEDILAYYTRVAGEEIANKNLNTLLESVNTLELHPFRCRAGRVANTYEHVIAKLPYIAVFSIDDGKEPLVQVLDVIHTASLYP
jgi:plasmid stabilization system protein ParE